MDTIERYLRTLRMLLPADQRDDIVRELSEEIESQVADKEAALGRALTADEHAAILRQYGHPLLTAARYRPQRHLIGPIVFPYYWIVLKVTLALMILGHAAGAAVLVAGGASLGDLGKALEDAFANVLKAAAWITALGAFADFWLARSRALERWSPTVAIGPHRTNWLSSLPSHAAEPSVSRFVLSVVVAVWWLIGLRFPFLFLGSGAAGVEWGPAMDRMYPVLVIAQVTMLVEQFMALRRSEHSAILRVTRVVWFIAGLAVIYLVATSDHQWMIWSGDAAARANATIVLRLAGRAVSLVEFVNGIWSSVLIVVAVASGWTLLKAVFARFRGTPTTAHAVILALALSVQTVSSSSPSSLSDTDIHKILVDRIDVQRQSVGIVVGVASPSGRRVVSHGTFGINDTRPIAGDAVFEIGSVTKVFTSWLLADMARRGEVRLSDPAARYFPTGTTVKPASHGKTITLADLATHTAGLPFWPTNVPATGNINAALSSYTPAQLFEFMSTFDVPPDVGTRWAYSNVDAGLLGILLGGRAGSTYDAWLAARITNRLRMTSTAVTVSSDMTPRLVTGHNAQLNVAPRWTVPAMAGGGSLHSSANDLLTFLAALGDAESPIAAALPTMIETRRQGPGFQQALGWMVIGRTPDEEMLFHDGQTLGFASSIAYDPRARTGVVVLSNAAAGVGDIARHVLRPAIPLAKPAGPAPRKTEIQVDLKLFDLYAGQYEPGPGTIFAVSREGDSLMLQVPGLPKLRLRPESETDFFVAENTRITVTFEVSSGGQVTRMMLKAPTGNVPAARRH